MQNNCRLRALFIRDDLWIFTYQRMRMQISALHLTVYLSELLTGDRCFSCSMKFLETMNLKYCVYSCEGLGWIMVQKTGAFEKTKDTMSFPDRCLSLRLYMLRNLCFTWLLIDIYKWNQEFSTGKKKDSCFQAIYLLCFCLTLNYIKYHPTYLYLGYYCNLKSSWQYKYRHANWCYTFLLYLLTYSFF